MPVVLLLAVAVHASAQTLSLKQCIQYARENNSNLKIASVESAISRKKVTQQIGKMLPQIDASGNVTNNLEIATTMLPGEIVGEPGTYVPVKMGTKYAATGSLELSQSILDASFWTGLHSADLNNTQSELNVQKTEESTLYDACLAYYRALVVQKQWENLKVILAVSKQSLESTTLRFQNGMAKKIDVDKIRVSYNSTYTQVQQAEMNYRQALNNLKYAIGMPVDSTVVLADTLTEPTQLPVAGVPPSDAVLNNRIDYRLQQINLDVQQADKWNNIAAYLPTVSLFARYNYNAMSQNFDIFETGSDWYRSSAIGVQVKIPIFSGFQRLSKVSQSALNVEKAEESLKLKEQSIKVELSNYEIQYRSALDNITIQKETMLLAQSVYSNTQLDYKEGKSSSLDLVQAESALRETQNTYYSKLLAFHTAKLDMEKAKGTLIDFINNLN